jgi:hypothetical protein
MGLVVSRAISNRGCNVGCPCADILWDGYDLLEPCELRNYLLGVCCVKRGASSWHVSSGEDTGLVNMGSRKEGRKEKITSKTSHKDMGRISSRKMDEVATTTVGLANNAAGLYRPDRPSPSWCVRIFFCTVRTVRPRPGVCESSLTADLC